ncbi:MAG: hypothetical protein HQL82_14575 [Magnetococcales bacterium]|nr:hypothetical protein [Magnetococcales bacterium]
MKARPRTSIAPSMTAMLKKIGQKTRKRLNRQTLMSLFSYMSILCLIPLLVNREDPFIDFHARQGLVLWIWSVISVFALLLPGYGPFFSSISALAITVFSMVGMLSVILGKRWPLPVIHRMVAWL